MKKGSMAILVTSMCFQAAYADMIGGGKTGDSGTPVVSDTCLQTECTFSAESPDTNWWQMLLETLKEAVSDKE